MSIGIFLTDNFLMRELEMNLVSEKICYIIVKTDLS